MTTLDTILVRQQRQESRRAHVRWLMAGACFSSAVLDRVLGRIKLVTVPSGSPTRH